MWTLLLKILSVYLMSMFKFILGPVGGKAEGLHVVVTAVATACGMMTVVMLLTFFGEPIRNRLSRWFGKRLRHDAPESEHQHRWKVLFARYGVSGIALLTPLILTPIGGALLAVGLGIPRAKIISAMLFSACFWSVILSYGVYFGVDLVVHWARELAIF